MCDLLLIDDFLATPDRFLFHPPTGTAILADLHLGYEATLASRGTLMPDITTEPLFAAFERMLSRDPRRIVIAGDLFETAQPDATTIDFARFLFSLTEEDVIIEIIPGNHDPDLSEMKSMFANTIISVLESATVAGWRVVHGHEITPPSAPAPPRGLIVGHQHPAVTFTTRTQTAKMLCFAVVNIPDSLSPQTPLILLPPFSPAPLGSNLLNARHWILDTPEPDPAHVRIAGIVDRRVLDFGPLAGL